jgi:hypothetical protein
MFSALEDDVDGPSWNNFVDIAALGYMLLNSTSLPALSVRSPHRRVGAGRH